jgi:hypothetical protein
MHKVQASAYGVLKNLWTLALDTGQLHTKVPDIRYQKQKAPPAAAVPCVNLQPFFYSR